MQIDERALEDAEDALAAEVRKGLPSLGLRCDCPDCDEKAKAVVRAVVSAYLSASQPQAEAAQAPEAGAVVEMPYHPGRWITQPSDGWSYPSEEAALAALAAQPQAEAAGAVGDEALYWERIAVAEKVKATAAEAKLRIAMEALWEIEETDYRVGMTGDPTPGKFSRIARDAKTRIDGGSDDR